MAELVNSRVLEIFIPGALEGLGAGVEAHFSVVG